MLAYKKTPHHFLSSEKGLYCHEGGQEEGKCFSECGRGETVQQRGKS